MGQGRNKFAALVAVVVGFNIATPTSADPVGSSLRPLARPVENTNVQPSVVVQPNESAEVSNSRIPLPRPNTLLDTHVFRLALNASAQKEFDVARTLAAKEGPIALDIIEWQRLRQGVGSFEEYLTFLDRNADWPGLKLLRRRGEPAILSDASANGVLAFFAPEPPQTGNGSLRLVEAYARLGDFKSSRAELIRGWTSLKMSAEEEAAILAKHADALTSFHVARLDDALWRKDIEGARRMLRFVDQKNKAIAEARIALQKRSGDANTLVENLPRSSRNGGVMRDLMRWYVAKKDRNAAANVILQNSKSRDALGRPKEWAEWRSILARQEMRNGNSKRAYELASQHFLETGSDFADLEWIAGYVALSKLNRPSDALRHFRRFRTAVFTPISLARAGYWEGRALEALGDRTAATNAYRDAAQYQTAFYGLLAAEKINAKMLPDMTGRGQVLPWQSTQFAKSSVFAAAGLMHRAGEQYEVTRFLRHLAETTAESELVTLTDYANSLDDPYIAVRVAKLVADRGVTAYRAYYPLTPISDGRLPVEKALALSIARRESEFYSNAVSGAGARGLMQLMPGTAQDMARELNIPYEKSRLTSDPVYNAKLGSAYLAFLEKEYDKSIALISVGYNAGPHRANRWSTLYGDPRRRNVDIVDWVEHIPFNETRNYVMRVAESLPVYRARLTGMTQPIEISKELKGLN